jgi:hypothetical protein
MDACRTSGKADVSWEVADSNILAITTSLPLDQFAAIHQSTPTQIFDQAIQE